MGKGLHSHFAIKVRKRRRHRSKIDLHFVNQASSLKATDGGERRNRTQDFALPAFLSAHYSPSTVYFFGRRTTCLCFAVFATGKC
jgi:hypothetical protein